MSRPQRPRRSCHAVPASASRMIERAADLDADLVFLDLEDSVAVAAKDEARRAAAAALAGGGFRAPTVGVRVNAVDSPWCHRDLVEVVARAGARLDVVIVPKVGGPGQVAYCDHLIAALERERDLPVGGIGLEVQIEGADGLVAAEAIAAAAPRRLEALVFGPGDFAASVGMPTTTIGGEAPGYPGDAFHHALARLLVAARAHGLQAVDGPYARIRDPDGLRRSALRSRALGYDGKWSVHPDQIATLNEVYGAAPAELERARAILDAARAADAEGRGAAMHEGEMIDEATRRMAGRVLARARAPDAAP